MAERKEEKCEVIPWVDIETTGLKPEVDQMLEIALVITNLGLEELTAWSFVIKPSSPLTMDPIVVDMHSKNGLLAALTDGASLEGVEETLITAMMDYKAIGGVMGGSSVHFDRSFIKVHMPKFHKLFSYRNFDVRTLHRANEWWMPKPRSRKDSAHRALLDIRETIAEARVYREMWIEFEKVRRTSDVLPEGGFPGESADWGGSPAGARK